MKKSTFEQMDGTYREEGDHLLPNLTVPGNISVGIWGKRRRRYLRKHRQTLYTALLFGGKLDTHLAEIDRQAENMFSQLVMRCSLETRCKYFQRDTEKPRSQAVPGLFAILCPGRKIGALCRF